MRRASNPNISDQQRTPLASSTHLNPLPSQLYDKILKTHLDQPAAGSPDYLKRYEIGAYPKDFFFHKYGSKGKGHQYNLPPLNHSIETILKPKPVVADGSTYKDTFTIQPRVDSSNQKPRNKGYYPQAFTSEIACGTGFGKSSFDGHLHTSNPYLVKQGYTGVNVNNKPRSNLSSSQVESLINVSHHQRKRGVSDSLDRLQQSYDAEIANNKEASSKRNQEEISSKRRHIRVDPVGFV